KSVSNIADDAANVRSFRIWHVAQKLERQVHLLGPHPVDFRRRNPQLVDQIAGPRNHARRHLDGNERADARHGATSRELCPQSVHSTSSRGTSSCRSHSRRTSPRPYAQTSNCRLSRSSTSLGVSSWRSVLIVLAM